MVKVPAKQYQLAKDLGFVPSKRVKRTTTGNNYFLEDSDMRLLKRVVNQKIIEFKGVK